VRELDHDRILLRQVAETVWARLHVYERQEQQENERLDAALQKADLTGEVALRAGGLSRGRTAPAQTPKNSDE
jgi:hypothetical protein